MLRRTILSGHTHLLSFDRRWRSKNMGLRWRRRVIWWCLSVCEAQRFISVCQAVCFIAYFILTITRLRCFDDTVWDHPDWSSRAHRAFGFPESVPRRSRSIWLRWKCTNKRKYRCCVYDQQNMPDWLEERRLHRTQFGSWICLSLYLQKLIPIPGISSR